MVFTRFGWKNPSNMSLEDLSKLTFSSLETPTADQLRANIIIEQVVDPEDSRKMVGHGFGLDGQTAKQIAAEMALKELAKRGYEHDYNWGGPPWPEE